MTASQNLTDACDPMAGTLATPRPFSMSPGMALAAARARAEQTPMSSLAGIRE